MKALKRFFQQPNILEIIDNGIKEYHKCVDAMTDQELWQHINDLGENENVNPSDYCVQVFDARGLKAEDFKTSDQ